MLSTKVRNNSNLSNTYCTTIDNVKIFDKIVRFLTYLYHKISNKSIKN